MMNVARRFAEWVRSFFVVVVVDAAAEPAPAIAASEPQVKRPRQSRQENFGSLYFREDLLDRLPEYMRHLSTIKREDPDAWSLYRRLGGAIATKHSMFAIQCLDPAWRANRPSFGLLYLSHTWDSKATIEATIIYYTKISYPRNHRIQAPPARSALYEMVVAGVWAGKSVLLSAHIAVGHDGRVYPLRHLIENGRWDFPEWVRWTCAENAGQADRITDPETLLRAQFTMTANHAVWSMGGGIQVRATKAGITASFNIHTERTPYFFADRDKEKNAAGSTKKIFHVARTHRRRLPDGREIVVPMHYRGLRRFTWHDYAVSVSVPGRDHAPIQEFAAEAVDKDSRQPKGMIPVSVAAERMAKHMDRQ